METSAVSGSLETPWFGQTFDKETFVTALDYRLGIVNLFEQRQVNFIASIN